MAAGGGTKCGCTSVPPHAAGVALIAPVHPPRASRQRALAVEEGGRRRRKEEGNRRPGAWRHRCTRCWWLSITRAVWRSCRVGGSVSEQLVRTCTKRVFCCSSYSFFSPWSSPYCMGRHQLRLSVALCAFFHVGWHPLVCVQSMAIRVVRSLSSWRDCLGKARWIPCIVEGTFTLLRCSVDGQPRLDLPVLRRGTGLLHVKCFKSTSRSAAHDIQFRCTTTIQRVLCRFTGGQLWGSRGRGFSPQKSPRFITCRPLDAHCSWNPGIRPRRPSISGIGGS